MASVAELQSAAPSLSPTAGDLVWLFGPVPMARVKAVGLSEAEAVVALERREMPCEYVDGFLVEKDVSAEASLIAGWVLTLLNLYVRPRRLGFVLAPDGLLRLGGGRLRMPDVSFIAAAQVPGGRFPSEPVPTLFPDLAVEVLSPGNTAREMEVKRADYFNAGTRLVWMIDPATRTVEVFTSPESSHRLTATDTLDGGDALPGLTLPVAEVFAAVELSGDAAPAAEA